MKHVKDIIQILLLLIILSSCAKELIYEEDSEKVLETYIYDGEKQSLSFTQETCGSLYDFVESHYLKNRLKSLTVIGPINGTDLACIREMSGSDMFGNKTAGILDSLDLSKSRFVEGGNAYFIEKNTDGYSQEEKYMQNDCVGQFSFYNCTSLNYIVLPDNIKTIGDKAFEGCSHLLNINLPKSINKLGKRVFANCPLLCPDFVEPDGFIIPEGITEIPDSMLFGCTIMSKIVLPKTLNNIGVSAFNGCRDAVFDIKASKLESFGEYAFAGCKKFTGIDLPPTMSSIPKSSFEGCSSLTKIRIPESIVSIGSHAFASSGIAGKLDLPKSLKHVGARAFYSTKISSLIINSDISCDEESMCWNGSDFGYCNSLKEVIVNEPVSFFELRFVHCDSLTKIMLPKSLKRFGSNHNGLYSSSEYGYNFYKCSSLSKIELPYGLDSIGTAVFAYTDLEEVVIPNSVSYIGNDSFKNCSKLVNVQIPQSVSYIDVAAFSDCSSLQAITLPNSIKFIGASTFRNCSVLKSVSLSKELKELEYGTFYGCKELERIEITGNIERIAPEVFIGCSKLQEVIFLAPVKTIENNAFSHCISLQEILLPNSLKKLDYGVFYNCSSLRTVVLPQSLDSIGNNAFLDCSSLSVVTNYSLKPQKISSSVFKGVQLSTSTLTVPNGTSDLYRVSDVWKQFGVITDDITMTDPY